MMKIIQFNCTSVRNKKPQLEQFLIDNGISIACLSETFLMSQDSIYFKNFEIIRADRNSTTRGGGVAILIQKPIVFKRVAIPSNFHPIEVCACEIETNSQSLCIFSFYIPPNSNFSTTHLNSIMSATTCRSKVICGDFNSHNMCWGSRNTDARGRKIMDFVDSCDLVVLNTGDPTYCGSTPSCIDLTFCSASVSLGSTWKVCRESLGSTHCIVETCINFAPKNKKMENSVSPKNIENSILNKKLVDIISSPAVLDASCPLDTFSQQFADSFLFKPKHKTKNSNPWWNVVCKKASASLRLANGRFLANPSRQNYHILMSNQKSYKYTIRSEKSKGWKKFCESIDCNITVSELWKVVRCFRGSFADSMSGFNECVVQFSRNLSGPLGPIQMLRPSGVRCNHFLVSPITYSELEKAISVSKNTAPGLDGLRNDHIKQFSAPVKVWLLEMFNNVISSGVIPHSWYKYKVIPLKKRCGNPTDASSYRSIAMASTLRKLFERIICSRLDWFIESNNKISNQQAGFRRNRSTADNIIALWSAINLAFVKKESLVAVFVDIKGAFDNVNISLLVSRLQLIGAPNMFCDLVYSLFQFKDIYIQTENGMLNNTSYTGVPQGCVLSPICFNVYIDDIFNGLPGTVHALGYADDVVIFCSDRDVVKACESVQLAINRVNDKLNNLELSLSTSKTKCMIFSKNNYSQYFLRPLYLNSIQLEIVDSFNFLGFIFHKKLCLIGHIERTIKNCFHFINVLRSLCGVTWGSDTRCLLLLYLGIIRPKLEYMAPLLLDCSKSKFIKLERIQWKCLRIALGAMVSTHTMSLEQTANVMPLAERYSLLSDGVVNKIVSTKFHPARFFILELITYSRSKGIQLHPFFEKFSEKLHYNIVSFDKHPMFIFSYASSYVKSVVKYLPIEKNNCTSAEVNLKFSTIINSTYKQFKRIFTDGSKSCNGVGSGVWMPELNVEAYFSLNNKSSVFTAEVRAILEALELIPLHCNDNKFLIISDSKSALMAIGNFCNSNTHPLIFQIKSTLLNLRARNKCVHFLWVPSHMGIPGNEHVDGIASDHPLYLDFSTLPLYRGDLKMYDKAAAVQLWQTRWDLSTFGRHLYSIAPHVNHIPWFYKSDLSRPIISMINRLRFNHTKCRDHIFRINIVQNNTCSCGHLQSSNHLLFSCNNINNSLRVDFLKKLLEMGIDFNMISVLKTYNIDIFKLIYQFFSMAKINI